jgi:hypothetical protein
MPPGGREKETSEQAMKVRSPKAHYGDVRPHWAPNHEFAQLLNGQSLIPAHVEPYLVKVMAKAKPLLDRADGALQQNLDVFIKQEMQHCKQHLIFNKVIRESGYPGVTPIEADYAADYNRYLAEMPLVWNLAYCEGFEAMSSIAVTVFFEEYDSYFEAADSQAVELWKWHLAEEYEHREVAHDVYHALASKNPVTAYIQRIQGFFAAVKHIRGYARRFSAYLLDLDRAAMAPAELEASKAREAEIGRAMARRSREHLIDILSPWYKPARRRPPRGLTAFLADFERRAAQAA